MNIYEILFSILMFLTSIIAIVISLKAKKTADAASDTQIFSSIVEAEKFIIEKGLKANYINDEKAFEVAQYLHCNQYEHACKQYLSSRIDKENFYDLHGNNIVVLVEDAMYKNIFYPDKGVCSYTSILEVYQELKDKGK